MNARQPSPNAQFSAFLSRFPPEIVALVRQCLPKLRRAFSGCYQLVYDYSNSLVVAFGMSWGPVVWVLLGEMFPNRIRAAALGLAAAGQWVANWLITVTFPALRDMLGLAYGFYALCAALSLLFVLRWVRETKGVALEDMHAELLEA